MSTLPALSLDVALVCCHGHMFDPDVEPCPNRPTRVMFFERGDAATYCDSHGPLAKRLTIIAVARLTDIQR